MQPLFDSKSSHGTHVTKIFHPLVAMIASATENELAKYVEYLKAENRILRARIPGEIPCYPKTHPT
jgi:hypothetical protein